MSVGFKNKTGVKSVTTSPDLSIIAIKIKDRYQIVVREVIAILHLGVKSSSHFVNVKRYIITVTIIWLQ